MIIYPGNPDFAFERKVVFLQDPTRIGHKITNTPMWRS